jgi:inosine/xanthosine triphosphate pyrophosphatase family protein
MKILIATHNPAKLKRYKSLVNEIPNLELITLTELNITAKVDEPHNTAKENAIHKAKEYANISGLPTIAIDEGVMTNFLPPEEQPGVFVKRIKKTNAEVTDEEILEHWKNIFQQYPQKTKKFIWDFSVAFFNPQTNFLGYAKFTKTMTVADVFSAKRSPGYPMSSFLIPAGMQKPYIDLSDAERKRVDNETFKQLIPQVKQWINGIQ